jgi:CheY-like chemotaxis protein
VISHRVGSVAITVRSVDGIREVAAKELGPLLAGPSHITGAALLGGGEVVLVLDAAALVARTRSVPAEELPGSRVLVVDDSIGARAVVSGALASSGFVTSVASSASEALDILAGNEVDALVVDFSMPQQDGADLVAEVRERGINVPVVMLSGVASEEDKTRSKEAGVDVFFDKADFREGALAETLRGMLGSS